MKVLLDSRQESIWWRELSSQKLMHIYKNTKKYIYSVTSLNSTTIHRAGLENLMPNKLIGTFFTGESYLVTTEYST